MLFHILRKGNHDKCLWLLALLSSLKGSLQSQQVAPVSARPASDNDMTTGNTALVAGNGDLSPTPPPVTGQTWHMLFLLWISQTTEMLWQVSYNFGCSRSYAPKGCIIHWMIHPILMFSMLSRIIFVDIIMTGSHASELVLVNLGFFATFAKSSPVRPLNWSNCWIKMI